MPSQSAEEPPATDNVVAFLSPAMQAESREQARKFTACVYKNADPLSFVNLRSFHQETGRLQGTTGVKVSDLLHPTSTSLATWIQDAAENRGVFCPPACTFGHPDRARESDLANGVAIIVDIDSGNVPAKLARLVDVLGQPTLTLASGGTCHDPDTGEVYQKQHAYWRLRIPTRDSSAHLQLKRARKLAALIAGADPTGNTLVHPFRIAGSWHLKNPLKPTMARIVQIDDNRDVDLGQTLAALEAAAGSLPKEPKEPAASGQRPQPLAEGGTPEALAKLAYWRQAIEDVVGDESPYHEINSGSHLIGRYVASGELNEEVARKELEVAIANCSSTHQSQKPWPQTYELAFSEGLTKPLEREPVNDNRAEDVFQVLEEAPPEQPKTTKAARKFSLEIKTTEQCAYDPDNDDGYIWQDRLAPGNLACTFGDPGSGKSMFVPALCYAIAQEREFCGKKTKRGRVLYTCNEDLGGTEGRIDVLAKQHGHCPNFRFVKGIDMQDPDNVADLLAYARAWRPAVVVVDTLLATWAGVDENDSKGMGEIIRACRQHCALGAAVIVITHPAKNGAKMPREHSSFHGTTEVSMFLPPNPTAGVTRVQYIKNKNGSLLQDVAFSIGSAVRGYNHDGDEITSPIAIPLGGNATPQDLRARAQQDAKLSSSEQLGLKSLADCVAAAGGVSAKEDAWFADFVSKRPAATKDANRKAFARVVQSLQTKDRVVKEGDLVRIKPLMTPHFSFGEEDALGYSFAPDESSDPEGFTEEDILEIEDIDVVYAAALQAA